MYVSMYIYVCIYIMNTERKRERERKKEKESVFGQTFVADPRPHTPTQNPVFGKRSLLIHPASPFSILCSTVSVVMLLYVLIILQVCMCVCV
jgi:hypothetical protein